MGENPPDEPRGDRPTCAREEVRAEPNADLVEVDLEGMLDSPCGDAGSVGLLELSCNRDKVPGLVARQSPHRWTGVSADGTSAARRQQASRSFRCPFLAQSGQANYAPFVHYWTKANNGRFWPLMAWSLMTLSGHPT
jgi:hypothetical protein